MSMRPNVSKAILMAAVACTAISAGNADAVLVFEFIQQGNDVGLNVSGSLTGLPGGTPASVAFSPHVEPAFGSIISGTFNGTDYSISGSFSDFGSGTVTAMSYSGDSVYLAGGAGSLTLPSTYVQGTPITGTGLLTGQTLAGLGLSSTTPGLLRTWTVGSDSIEVRVGSQTSPSPAAAPGPLPLLGAGAAFAASRRLRARLNAGSSSPLG